MEHSKYQLVVEFAAPGIDDFNRLGAWMEAIDEKLLYGDVDGNDIGGGVFNLFVITDYPEKCFEEVIGLCRMIKSHPVAAGYRLLDADKYVRLWPEDDSSQFELH